MYGDLCHGSERGVLRGVLTIRLDCHRPGLCPASGGPVRVLMRRPRREDLRSCDLYTSVLPQDAAWDLDGRPSPRLGRGAERSGLEILATSERNKRVSEVVVDSRADP